MNFTSEYQKLRNTVDAALESIVSDGVCPELKAAVNYSLLGGGKRLRPVLYLSVLRAYGVAATENDVKVACAIECIHTYSLIHDDLPAMDNDDYRRGRPTNHKKFGEAIAILAGDGLLNLAYELLADVAMRDGKYAAVMRIVSENAGMRGMVGGQAYEFAATEDTAEHIAYLKTGKLIEAAIVSAVHAAGKDEDEEIWREFAVAFGKAFQFRDDLLDMTEEEAEKRGVKRSLERFYAAALNALDKTNCDTAFLRALTDKMLSRTTDGI